MQAPPDVPRPAPVNPIARLLPVAMVVAVAGMMVVYFSSGAALMRNPMFMFFPVMMLVSTLGTLAYGARGSNRTGEINEDRRDYLRYIEGLHQGISKTADAQHQSLHWSHPEPGSLWTLVGSRRMWERRVGDSDFCHVRVGLGAQRLSTRLVAPELGPADELDPVTSIALRRLIRHRSVVTDLPIAVALPNFPVISIAGDADAVRALVRAIACQLAVLHSPDHLQVVAVVDAGAEAEWEWLKWLPHHQHPHDVDDLGSARMLYRRLDEALRCIPEGGESTQVAMILDGGAVEGAGRLGTPRGGGKVTVLAVGAGYEALADHNGLTLHIGADGLSANSDAGDEVFARPDTMTRTQALVCARRLASYRPRAAPIGNSLRPSTMTSWPDLMGIADPARVDAAVGWRVRRTRPNLRVPIGVSEHGAPVELDIKEAAQDGMGPHGLCVGATGSGKSEFLRTLILGLITAHPPEDLNLVLVDFKGGATFLGLERARHVAAVITNLADEAHLVARMKDALAGEMNRRQELLRTAGNFANVADYQRARSNGAALALLPALFVVVDEFSELLSQHPDFAELFVGIGRLGRSLGMHLLLASQRLDEGRLRGLESHLSYRICLKTFSANESRAVLGVADAYHLPSTPGAAYLKTASAGPLRFQTAFVSGPCVERDRSTNRIENLTPRLFTAAATGHVRGRADHRPDAVITTKRTLLDTVLDLLAGHGTPAHPVWLAPLTESPTLGSLLAPGGADPLRLPIGLVDSPFEQRRDPLVVDLAGPAGNMAVVGGPRSGKSTALRTLVLALAATHDPAEAQFYCLDFGGGSLSSLRSLPHVGSVAGRLDADLIRRTVAELHSVVHARENRFRRLGIDSVTEYRRRRAAGDRDVADDPFGDVFLVIDGWATFRQEFDTLEGPITSLAAQGLSFGVHVVVAAARWAEIRPAFKDQIGTRVELRLGDPAESEMDRKRARQLTDSPPGRGITRDGREMVIALPRLDEVPATTGLAEAIAATAEGLCARYDGRSAPPVALLPAHVHHDAVVAAAGDRTTAAQILLGIGERELHPVALDFVEQPHLIILGEAECGKTTALRMLCREVVRSNGADSAQLVIVDLRRTLLGVVETDHLAGYAISAVALTSQLPALLDRLQARMPGEGVTQHQLRTRSWWSGPDIYLVIDDYDLVASATGNPLTPLLDFLPHAKDLGLHVVVARRSGGAARAMFDPLLARLRDLGCMGMMMSANPDEGVLLGSVRPSPLPPGRGTLITRAHPDQLVQVAWTDPP